MTIPVIAKKDLDAYIPDTEIVVKIPSGTEGHIVRELRNDIVLVDFNVSGLTALRVSVSDLEMQDALELLIDQMKGIQNLPTTDITNAHTEVAKIVTRALRFLADETNREKVESFINKYELALRWVYSNREKSKTK